jgi:hypothetical protein
VSQKAKQHGGPHKVQWTGCELAANITLECRIIFRGDASLDEGKRVDSNVELLPIPAENEFLEVDVILGPTETTSGYPRERTGQTDLLSEGRLSDGRRVWVVYVIRNVQNDRISSLTTDDPNSFASYLDPDADLNRTGLRALLCGTQSDGSLAFLDLKATWRPSA